MLTAAKIMFYFQLNRRDGDGILALFKKKIENKDNDSEEVILSTDYGCLIIPFSLTKL